MAEEKWHDVGSADELGKRTRSRPSAPGTTPIALVSP